MAAADPIAGAPRALVRADAGPAIGLGHVMRCLAVAEALIDAGWCCRFAALALPVGLADRLAEAGLALTAPPAAPVAAGCSGDLAWTVAAHRRDRARLVLLDSYALGSAWRAGLAGTGVWVATFDDMAETRPLHADIVINPAPTAPGLAYPRIAPGATALLGPAYLPIRRGLRGIAPPPLAARRSLLVLFGGSDPRGLTGPCLTALARRFAGTADRPRLVGVIGAANPEPPSAIAGATLLVDPPDLGVLFAEAGLAVSAAGGTLAELAVAGVPTLRVIVADNQIAAAAPAGAGRPAVIDARDRPATAVAAEVADRAAGLWADPTARAGLAADRPDGAGAVRIAAALAARIEPARV